MESRDFGEAIKALKSGYKVAREGWNGKNMFIYLNKGNFDFREATKEVLEAECFTIGGVCKELFKSGPEGSVTRMPNINMKAADGSTVTGWLASQTDMLADDWTVVS